MCSAVQLLASDPDFIYVNQNAKYADEWIDRKTREALEERCVRFLSKFGRNKWCIELQFMADTYIDLLKRHPYSVFGKYRQLVSVVPDMKYYLD